jgi:hypothetical protein
MATGDGAVLLEQQVESLRAAPGSAAGITPNQAQQQTAAATSMPGLHGTLRRQPLLSWVVSSPEERLASGTRCPHACR